MEHDIIYLGLIIPAMILIYIGVRFYITSLIDKFNKEKLDVKTKSQTTNISEIYNKNKSKTPVSEMQNVSNKIFKTVVTNNITETVSRLNKNIERYKLFNKIFFMIILSICLLCTTVVIKQMVFTDILTEINNSQQNIILQHQNTIVFNGTITISHNNQILNKIVDNQRVSYMTDAIVIAVAIMISTSFAIFITIEFNIIRVKKI